MRPGTQYRLKVSLTAIDSHEEVPRVVRLVPGTVVTVAALIDASQFVQVTAEERIHEVLKDDLIAAGSRNDPAKAAAK